VKRSAEEPFGYGGQHLDLTVLEAVIIDVLWGESVSTQENIERLEKKKNDNEDFIKKSNMSELLVGAKILIEEEKKLDAWFYIPLICTIMPIVATILSYHNNYNNDLTFYEFIIGWKIIPFIIVIPSAILAFLRYKYISNYASERLEEVFEIDRLKSRLKKENTDLEIEITRRKEILSKEQALAREAERQRQLEMEERLRREAAERQRAEERKRMAAAMALFGYAGQPLKQADLEERYEHLRGLIAANYETPFADLDHLESTYELLKGLFN